mmetsp:Transcript_50760/g.99474  ORF Transcript_50760/g.99474 Transcript_50760/m.99474 type:complete len:476 (-) Transcript_50760:238-1665(-)|eukprot:CAMPEP_0175126168 /NCGR_PEP_ID=MMETSP0087-20121206/3703_1 /TAXON_ID=136419 /ORGANISM="Unknown Unknown, Strain D1" /LENGTH=475 /DNA_ID=CAMNT_0016408049 /DNA_START=35 /DNA_END=1462 /DNA_ORIENTATION=-
MPKSNKKRGRKRGGDDQASARTQPGTGQQEEETIDNLRFEDPFEDEMEDEEIVNSDQNEQMKDDEQKHQPQYVFRPGIDQLEEGEEMDYDESAYTAFHRMTVNWPCLSFDCIKDSLGHQRSKFPVTFYLAAGTQASDVKQNKVMLLKIADLSKTQQQDPDNSDEDESDDESLDEDPILEEKSFSHPGGVNRLRSMPQSPNIISTFSDTGKVHVWDAQHLLRALDKPPTQMLPAMQPIFTFAGHSTEGFAMNWSRVTPGRFLTGDCAKGLYCWERQESTWAIDSTPYTGHTDSVEDLQWSPNEANVFASCSVDKTIRIWDTRVKKKSMIFVAAHQTDVNVISWNPLVSHLLLSGADDGSVKVWDLRNFKSSSPAANFKWHRAPITSVEWHPTDESIMCVSSDDDSISIWDMALEEDTEAKPEGAQLPTDMEIPPQLLFLHQGQKSVKEAHFHPQIPGLLVSTALDGFNIFKPSNLH